MPPLQVCGVHSCNRAPGARCRRTARNPPPPSSTNVRPPRVHELICVEGLIYLL